MVLHQASAAPPPPHGAHRLPPPRWPLNPTHSLRYPLTLRASSVPLPSILSPRVADWPRQAGRLSSPAARRVGAPGHTADASQPQHARRRTIRTPAAVSNRTNQLPWSSCACRRGICARQRRPGLDTARTLAFVTRRPAACRAAPLGRRPPASPGANPGAEAL